MLITDICDFHTRIYWNTVWQIVFSSCPENQEIASSRGTIKRFTCSGTKLITQLPIFPHTFIIFLHSYRSISKSELCHMKLFTSRHYNYLIYSNTISEPVSLGSTSKQTMLDNNYQVLFDTSGSDCLCRTDAKFVYSHQTERRIGFFFRLSSFSDCSFLPEIIHDVLQASTIFLSDQLRSCPANRSKNRFFFRLVTREIISRF